MGTRAVIEFYDVRCRKPIAVVYRSHDADLDGLGRDLLSFVETVDKDIYLGHEQLNAFRGAGLLAALWTTYDQIWNSCMIAMHPKNHAIRVIESKKKEQLEPDPYHVTLSKEVVKTGYLRPHYVAIVDPNRSPRSMDIDFTYDVYCDGKPTILINGKKLDDIVKPKKFKKDRWIFTPETLFDIEEIE